MSGIVGVLKTMVSLCYYLILFYILHIIWKKIREKKVQVFAEYSESFLYKVTIFLSIILVLIWSFAYYYNEINPASVPQYMISNGEKKVVFQWMSHIASQDFYDSVKKELTLKKEEGYVYYYEQVLPGTPENMEKFNKEIGIKVNKDLYKNLSKLYWVVPQDNSMYINIWKTKDYNIDMSIDEIMKIYNKKNKNNEEKWGIQEEKKILNIDKELINKLDSLHARELKLLQYINKAFINAILWSEKMQYLMVSSLKNRSLGEVILGGRNKLLANKIISSADNKIFITYGALHFEGVLDILKKSDMNWKITQVKNFYPMK